MATFHDITAAVVGAGFIGPVHVEGLRRAGVRVKGIAGISHEEAAARRRGARPRAAYKDVDELLRQGRPQRAPGLAQPPAPRPRDGRPPGRQAHHLREAAGDDLGPDRRARRRREGAAIADRGRQLQPALLPAHAARPRAREGADARQACCTCRAATCRTGCSTPPTSTGACCASEGGELRAVGDIGTHWLDLVSFVTGLEVEAVFADLMTVHETRLRPPSGSIETFAGKQGGRSRPTASR
jgi:hypothetical protein